MRGRKSSKCRDVIICDETISNESEAFQYFSNDVCGMKLTVLLSKMCTKVFPQEITKNSWRILSLKDAIVTKVKRDDTQYILHTDGHKMKTKPSTSQILIFLFTFIHDVWYYLSVLKSLAVRKKDYLQFALVFFDPLNPLEIKSKVLSLRNGACVLGKRKSNLLLLSTEKIGIPPGFL